MPAADKSVHRLVIVGTGNFATNLAALLESFGLDIVFFVDEQRTGEFLGKPVFNAAALGAAELAMVDKWTVAISQPEHRRAAVARLWTRGIAGSSIVALADDPDLQILRFLFEQHSPAAVADFCAPGVQSVGTLEDKFLRAERTRVLAALDPSRQTIGLGYYGRGGGFRRHISALVPLLADRFNVVTMSDEMMGHAGEAPHHLYLGTGTACTLDLCDLILSAHVFPCAPPTVPRVSFSHVIYDFNLTAEYHAARIARSEVHYLYASSQPCFDGYVDLVRRHGLTNRICVIPGGYLQLDANVAALVDTSDEANGILYAPTLALADYPQRDLVSSVAQGPALLAELLAGFPGREIIFRPHPSDLRLYEMARRDPRSRALGQMLALCADEPRCRLDDNATSYLDSYRRASLLVSDSSSTAFTFAFATGRPVLFFSPREQEMKRALGSRLRFVADRGRVGEVVTSLGDVVPVARRLLSRSGIEDPSLTRLRDEVIFNPGRAARYFLDNVDFVLSGQQHPDWHYINW